MTTTPRTPSPALERAWLDDGDCSLTDLQAVVEQVTEPHHYPHADRIESNVVVYHGDRLRDGVASVQTRRAIQSELVHALQDGPGIVVFERAFADATVVDRVTELFTETIADQHAMGATAGDHFAKPGANDRVWNALEKLAIRAPSVFADYYANDLIALVSLAWLGPGYQVTSQVNVVNPGGAAQQPHRDYHLGFLPTDVAQRYPAHVHRLSPVLTLQGAVAHCDMPVESGPTMYLPHSQKYLPGYLAAGLPAFQAYFEASHVQLPLAKGDAVFFNPALMHAAGFNRSSSIRRMANLLQISSAFGRAMESVDRTRAAQAVYPTLQAWKGAGVPELSIRNVIAATAEGYPFPTNLDVDPPVDGLAPKSQAEIVWQGLSEGWDPARLGDELSAHLRRRGSQV
jgi:ectoine hydroxylase-related dioxygenase (phytanoyl-CoA dioxygenase family)